MIDRLSDTHTNAQSQLAGLLAMWTQSKRLYNVSGDGAVNDLMVEQFSLIDHISEPFVLQLTVLTLDARLPLRELMHRRITLTAKLSDGSLKKRSGIIDRVTQLGSDGGFQRLQLIVKPWIAFLAHSSHSRAWQQKTVPQILDDVFGSYSNHAAWRFGEVAADGSTEDLTAFLAQGPNAGVLDYCCQYRETDLAFMQRLLASVGLGWRIEESEDAPTGHSLVVFADSARWPENPSSASATGGAGLKFHRSAATEEQDTIQAFGGQRSLNPAATAVLQWDYLQKRAVAVMVPTNHQFGAQPVQDMAAWLESYQSSGVSADGGTCTTAQLQHLATLGQQAHEFRNKTWLVRSSVRSLRAGQWFKLKNSTLDVLADLGHDDTDLEFSVHSVHALGINNLPKELSERIAQTVANAEWDDFDWLADKSRPDPMAELLASVADDPELSEQAAATGYANRFEACRRAIPWRPVYLKKPTALGPQTAIVVGPSGNTTPNGADELYMDALGRIKVQFHWQSAAHADPRADNRSSCWVRVVQRWAGASMGHQFIPRIGQEVLVQFLNNDIDRPICTSTLYNGRGEGGLARTPGGQPGKSDTSVFAHSSDHRPSGQGNQVGSGSGGNSPAWHGGAPGPATAGANAQNNAAAMSGVKSKEFGGEGYNQLVFDDTPGQLRVQLATTQHASQLSLGYLIHQADNTRGSYRGTGFELRTDAYGAIRGAQGLLITSYGASQADPAGDNAAGMALLKQALTLADSFSQAAKTHQTTTLASAVGTIKASQSHLSDQLAPMKALHQAASGMVSQAAFDNALNDAGNKSTQAADGKLPHTTDPIVAITAKAGLAVVAGQDIQFASGEAISWQAGQDLHIAGGSQLRVNTGQSIGMLAGAVQAGEGAKGKGLTMIAGQGPVQMQAQAGQAQVAAKGLINIQSVVGAVEWASAKKITLQTAGGAQIVIQGSGITVQCPGKITIKAAQKLFVGPGSESYPLPKLPRSAMPERELIFNMVLSDTPGPTGHPLANTPWKIAHSREEPEGMALIEDSKLIASGQTDAKGKVELDAEQQKAVAKAYCQDPDGTWLVYPGHAVQLNVANEKPDWTPDEKLRHAMSASDFSGDLHPYRQADGLTDEIQYAKKASKAAGESSLPGKLNGS
jgi:type VI secretion system secreted protein VgrG